VRSGYRGDGNRIRTGQEGHSERSAVRLAGPGRFGAGQRDARLGGGKRLRAEASDRNLRVSPTWLVELLHSIVLSDRLEATKALLILTESRDDSTLGLIRDRALET